MNNSIWLSGVEMPEFPRLNYEPKTDVLIVGGGIAGILTAYYLKQSGIDCILVEKNRICRGVICGTTGKITAQHGLLYSKLLKKDGLEKATKYLKANLSALDEYKKLCSKIDCDFEIRDNYVYSYDNRTELEDEISALHKIGYKAELCEDLPLPFKTVGGVKFPEQAQLHPLKFLKEIAKDLNIFENTQVLDIEGKTAITNCGKIEAEKIIITTHFPFIDSHGSYFIKLYQHRSYGIAISGAEEIDGMYVSSDKKGLSLRMYNDKLILVGGSHRTGKKGGNFEILRKFAKDNYNNFKEEFAWGAQDCMSLDEKPYIGNYSKNTPNMFVATGFNKWGITGSMVAAKILTDLCSGKENEFADAFSPSRSVMKPQLFVNGFESVTNLLNPFGKRCSHLGCSLKWNKAEHSWDCPCHGSRFDTDGNILNNPANKKLK